MVAVAQLVSALVCGAGSRGFESHQPPMEKELNSDLTPFYFRNFFISLKN